MAGKKIVRDVIRATETKKKCLNTLVKMWPWRLLSNDEDEEMIWKGRKYIARSIYYIDLFITIMQYDSSIYIFNLIGYQSCFHFIVDIWKRKTQCFIVMNTILCFSIKNIII